MKKQSSRKIKSKPVQTKTTRKPQVKGRLALGTGDSSKEKEMVADDAKRRALWKKSRRQFWSNRLSRVLNAMAVSEKKKVRKEKG